MALQLADLTIPFSPSQHSTTVSVGYWLPGKPFGSTYTVLPSSGISFLPEHLVQSTKFSIYSVRQPLPKL
ncbi:hypothetical protein T4A_14249 [Trichinella pseudospiralis]|uniref:Uncharacterized protein n=1 Tax=Trichinella pseudospiralis TaxID=6337 RepID=A0A0V1DNS2_TRIPS|nr:hypothetical protein T4A_14249 [Trichinella pseudospiralis]